MSEVHRAVCHPLRASLTAFAAGVVMFMQCGVATAGLTLMHGYVDYASALLWIQTDAPGTVEVVWRVEGDADVHRAAFDARAAENNIVLARLTGLLPGKQASYAVVGDGERREGVLRAQPRWTRAADAQDIAIAIGSCFFLADANPIWGSQNYGGGYEILDAIAAKKPDVMVWMGDNLYFQPQDELDPASMASRYRRQRTLPSLKTLLTAASHVAIWDDHDYGPNDADLSYTMKGEALSLFRRYWANPSYGLPETPGIFGRARFGDIDIFLLDDRYYRSANKLLDGPDKTRRSSWS
jgi:alkaline phosphatase D